MSEVQVSYHPDLASIARWIPRALVRRWTIPLMSTAYAVTTAFAKGGTRVDLDTTSVWVYRPTNAAAPQPGPAILWLHGGGMLLGDAREHQDGNQRLADELGIPVVSVQYRLSKTSAFPAGLDDCMQALYWIAQQEDVDPRLIVVMGVSGGGGLAAQVAQRATAEGKVVPCLQVLVYPMLDDRSSDAEHPHAAWYKTWDTVSNRLAWDRYLAGHDRGTPPRFAVPSRASSLRGLPPAWLGVGTLDLFHAEGTRYAERLEADGVPTELVVVDGGFHGFDVFATDAPVTAAFHASQTAAMRARWAELGWAV